MKPKFTICRLGAQEKVDKIDSIIKPDDLKKICLELTGDSSYEVVWVEQRIKGKLFKLETSDYNYYITYTPKSVEGRNSYIQSIPTALSEYLQQSLNEKNKKHQFCLYLTPTNDNNKTKYHQLIYRLLATIGVRFINTEELNGLNIDKYKNVRDLISDREKNRSKNRANQSSYITDEGSHYHIYGKTFGANEKETSILCYALCSVADKPIRLFQITDNNSTTISKKDLETINLFANNLKNTQIDILDDSYTFDTTETKTTNEENLRNPRFIFNLLEKTNGQKCCSLCHCKIESIVQGAHIYPIYAIKQRTDLTIEEKLEMATDKNNGIWLCENHHKLFDRGLIKFKNGELEYNNNKLTDSDKEFIEKISLCKKIETDYYTQEMQTYFKHREEFYQSENYY